MEQYIEDLAAVVKDDDWYKLMKFGREYLLDNQSFLMRLVVNRSKKMETSDSIRDVAITASVLIANLGMRIQKA